MIPQPNRVMEAVGASGAANVAAIGTLDASSLFAFSTVIPVALPLPAVAVSAGGSEMMPTADVDGTSEERIIINWKAIQRELGRKAVDCCNKWNCLRYHKLKKGPFEDSEVGRWVGG